MQIQKFSKPKKLLKIHEKDYSHGCLIDVPDFLSSNNPRSHTETKATEDNPKKIST